MNQILPRSFYARDTVTVAQELLGKRLIHIIEDKEVAGIIVETEAYTYDDPACHAFVGKTKRTHALFGPVGHAYVYFIYGNHYCFNVVAFDKSQLAGGVLIRALEPLEGISYMQNARKTSSITNLTNGPGKLTQALGISRNYYGMDLVKMDKLFITRGIEVFPPQVSTTTRIGIKKAQERKWRFYITKNSFVSK